MGKLLGQDVGPLRHLKLFFGAEPEHLEAMGEDLLDCDAPAVGLPASGVAMGPALELGVSGSWRSHCRKGLEVGNKGRPPGFVAPFAQTVGDDVLVDFGVLAHWVSSSLRAAAIARLISAMTAGSPPLSGWLAATFWR